VSKAKANYSVQRELRI